jgi:hypothetical protein
MVLNRSQAAMINRIWVRPLLICVFTFLQLLGIPAPGRATTIVAVRTPTDIHLGVDSKVTGVLPDGTVYYEVRCKIGQVGKIFFCRRWTVWVRAYGGKHSIIVDRSRARQKQPEHQVKIPSCPVYTGIKLTEEQS